MTYGSGLRRIGWLAVLVTCTLLYMMLHLRVNAVQSEVELAERKIVSLERQKFLLETEFETRSNQQQLFAWNEVEFGYQAPGASQFLEQERDLAQYGKPRAADAPVPIMVANAPHEEVEDSIFPAMVSPLTGRAMAAELPQIQQGAREALLAPRAEQAAEAAHDLAETMAGATVRVALDAELGSGR